jgi:hypothetical protein
MDDILDVLEKGYNLEVHVHFKHDSTTVRRAETFLTMIFSSFYKSI